MRSSDILDLRGDARAIGRQHGRALREPIRAFLADRLARINAVLPEPTSLAALRPTLHAYRRAIGGALPALLEEVDALAEGAGIGPDEALLLQLRRELTGYRRVRSGGDCSTLCVAGARGPLLAQTIDLNGGMAPQLNLLRIEHAATGRRVLLLSFTGLLGYLGMNDRGLAIGLNLLLAGDWRPGVPGYMAIRHLLDRADTVEQALALLRTLPLASSRSYTLCDRQRRCVVECLPGTVHELPAAVQAHTNHFLDPALAVHDELNPFARTSSRRRLDACERWLAGRDAPAQARDLFRLFAVPPLCVPQTAELRRECTVGAVVMDPVAGVMHVQRGTPSADAGLAVAVDGRRRPD